MQYDTMTPASLLAWLEVGQECAPIDLGEGDSATVARDEHGWLVTVDTADGYGRVTRRTHRCEGEAAEHELFGVLSAIGPW